MVVSTLGHFFPAAQQPKEKFLSYRLSERTVYSVGFPLNARLQTVVVHQLFHESSLQQGASGTEMGWNGSRKHGT